MNIQKEEILKKSVKFQGYRLGIEGLKIDFKNGNIGEFERVFFTSRKNIESPTYTNVMIIPILKNSDIVMIKQYCAGSEEQEYVFPKGGIVNSDSIEDSLNSELSEETGYAAQTFKKIGVVRALPTYVQLETSIFVATDLVPIEGIKGDELESISVHQFSFDEVENMIKNAEIKDARTICAFHFLTIDIK